ncbi:MAG TPA: prolipoprotein diacylglyceryl transferase, partial [Mariprofundaceae bacterium]|nr:prolipoprotein diacylglyceryl transferase [Mariprofundaceae bacterium]
NIGVAGSLAYSALMLAPQIDPIAIQLGPLAIHWYGLMYVLGFLATWYLVRMQLREAGLWQTRVSAEAYEGLFTALILGVVIGGRLGYILFYNFGYYMQHPIEMLYVWQGGMSFHGGLVGPIVAGWWYCRKHDLPFLKLADRFFTVAPIGLAFGRLGNFINGELWGRVADPAVVPWAMIFPHAGPDPRHPSQLYELMLEGVVLFFILWLLRKKDWPDGSRVGIFLVGYALARIVCENFRQPDAQLGFLFASVTMGMVLSSVMLLAGLAWLVLLFRKRAG